MKTRLQEVRKKAGFKNARAFAEHIGMPVATYTDYEQGRRSFTLEKAWEFADALECSLDELAGREVTPEMRRNSREAQALLDAREVLEQAIRASGYENLGDTPNSDDDGSDDDLIDEEADALSDGYSSSQGRSMLDAINEISSGER